MKQVHFTLYGKGGVGKSLIASLVAQYLEVDVINVRQPKDKSNFDELFNRIFEEDENFVIDSGPMTFFPLRQYILESDAINLISNHGKQVVMHTAITHDHGTHANLLMLVKDIPDTAKIVVWLNEVNGRIDGFEKTDTYLNSKDRIHGIVRLEWHQNSENTYRADIQKMLVEKLTFYEVNSSPKFGIMERHRLHRVKDEIYRQLEAVV